MKKQCAEKGWCKVAPLMQAGQHLNPVHGSSPSLHRALDQAHNVHDKANLKPNPTIGMHA